MARNYTTSLPGGTATTSIQVSGPQTFRTLQISLVNAAAGTLEVSLSQASQISTAAPTSDVICRVRNSATAGLLNVVIPIKVARRTLEYIYFHQTGAGNVGEVTIL